jgi:hypothetical protein
MYENDDLDPRSKVCRSELMLWYWLVLLVPLQLVVYPLSIGGRPLTIQAIQKDASALILKWRHFILGFQCCYCCFLYRATTTENVMLGTVSL